MGTMAAGAALSRQIDEVIIPEIDTYRISKLVAGAPVTNVVKDVAVTNTATNINILSYYADHKFNSGHPNLAAKRVTAIYGVPTYS